jgi:hypothetical protein
MASDQWAERGRRSRSCHRITVTNGEELIDMDSASSGADAYNWRNETTNKLADIEYAKYTKYVLCEMLIVLIVNIHYLAYAIRPVGIA